MKTKFFLFFLLVSFFGLLLFAPGASTQSKPIKIGFVGPLTGTASFLGQEPLRATNLEIEKVNKAGGINGRRIELVVNDDAANPNEALAAVTRAITKENVVAILGPYTSSAVLASMKDAERANVSMLTNAIAMKITEQGNKFIFRVNITSDIQAKAIAEYAGKTMNLKKAALIYPSDDFGMSQRNSFMKFAKDYGMSVVAEETHVPGATDFYTILTKFRATDAEVIVIASLLAEGTQIVIQSRELGLPQKLFAFGSLSDDKLQSMAGKAAEGVLMCTQFEATHPRNEPTKEFIESFKKLYGSPPNQFAGQGHAMVAILIDAIRRSKTAELVKIRDAMMVTNQLPTALGSISFEPNGQAIIKTMIAQIKDGKRVVIYAP